MLSTNKSQLRMGLNELSCLFPINDFRATSYHEVSNRNRYLFYYKNVLYKDMSFITPTIYPNDKVTPILKEYLINPDNSKIDMLDDCMNILLRDCNPIQYAVSISNINSIQLVCNIGQISSSTVINYRSLNKLIPKFKTSLLRGMITIPTAVELARLNDFAQYEIFKTFLANGIDLCNTKVNYRLISIAINTKYLDLKGDLGNNFKNMKDTLYI